MIQRLTIILSCLAALTGLGVQAEGDAAGPDFVALDGDQLGRLVDAHTSERIGELLADIASLGSRVPGAGNLPKTADWLSERIEQAGWEVLPRQPFRLAVPVDTGSELTYRRDDGVEMRVRLHPVWPNRTLCPFIPGGGLRAELVYVGDGDLSDFDGHEAFAPGAGVDAVALMEYDSGVHWETAAMLGARAVVFLPDADATARENENKFASSPVQVPRFYVADETAADELREQAEQGGSVTIAGGMQWQNRVFENVLALLPATESPETAETLLVTVRYDAGSVVPGASPGGQSAATLAAAVTVMETLADPGLRLRRRQNVLVMFEAARSVCYAGSRALSAVLQDVHAQWLAEWSRGADVPAVMETPLSKVKGMEPWIDRRLRAHRLRHGRLAATERWLLACRGEVVPFGYADPYVMERSFLVELADADEWLRDYLRKRVKQRQNEVLAELGRRERELGVDPFADVADVPAEIRALRARKEYCRVLAMRRNPQKLLTAIRTAGIDPDLLGPDDVTIESLLADVRGRLVEESERLRVIQQWADMRPLLRRLRVTRELALDISPGSDVLTLTRGRYVGGLSNDGARNEWAWGTGPMVSQFLERLQRAAERRVAGDRPVFRFVDGITFNPGRKTQAQVADGAQQLNIEMLQAGVTSSTLTTANDPRTRRFGPGDRVRTDAEALANLCIQARTLSLVLAQMLYKPSTLPHLKQHQAGATHVLGKVVKKDIRSGPFPNLPVPGCTVYFPPHEETVIGDVLQARWALSGPDGLFAFDAVPLGRRGRGKLEAFRRNEAGGMLAIAPDLSMAGRGGYNTTVERTTGEQFMRAVVFEGAALQFYGGIDPTVFFPLSGEPMIMEGRGGALDNWYTYVPAFGDSCATGVAVVPEDTALKSILTLSGYGNRMFLLGDQTDGARGEGYDVGSGRNLVHTPLAAAEALYRLNDERIGHLEARGVRPGIVTDLHRRSRAERDTMASALQRTAYAEAYAKARNIWARELRAYPKVRGVVDEAVIAVVIVLALLAPWAIFLERLVIKSGSIHGRVGGSTAFFAAGFLLLYVLHPAFRVTASPVVILIAYAVGALSLLAFGVVLNRYTAVMKRWTQRVGGVHSASISRGSAFMVAFNLGLTNMAKRPLRSGLTVTMISLLAFSVMTFTSVDTYMDVRLVPVGGEKRVDYDGVLFRLHEWQSISPTMAEAFESSFGPDVETARRLWYQKSELGWQIGIGANKFVCTRADTGESHVVEFWQGFRPEERRFSRLPDCVTGQWFSGADDEAILPTRVAEALGVTAADVVDVPPDEQVRLRYGEQELRVIGILDTAEADEVVDASGSAVSHLDFPASGIESLGKEGNLDRMSAPAGDEVNAAFMTFDRGILASYDAVRDLGGRIKNIVARFPEQADSRERLRDLMSRFHVNLYAAIDGRPHLVKAVNARSLSGAWKMVLPCVLVVLIVVNAMLGTVEERRSEIKMLGAVGLAPKHVTVLYLAESCVYGVLAVVFGVMLGLVVTWATGGMNVGLDVNYARVSTVLMGLGVLGVVVVSTLIPASRAAKLSTPSGSDEWEMEQDASGHARLRLPFTVTRDNGVGIFAFLHEYADGHWESTSPDFRCESLHGEIRPLPGSDSALVLSGRVWLAPYDMRVSQDIAISLMQQGDTALFEITYEARRLTGELEAWHRAGFVFVDLLRQQLLIYRTLSEEQKDAYFRRAQPLFRQSSGTANG